MRRALCLILGLFCLLSCACFAGQQTILFIPSAASSCDPSTNEVGNRGTGTNTSSDRYLDVIYVTPTTADCTGPLGYAKIYQPTSETKNVKVCVYTRTGSPPSASDTLVGCSGAIAFNSTASEWKPTDTSATVDGSVTSGNNYWIATIGQSSAYHFRYNSASSGAYYQTVSGSYSSPPATLSGTWTVNGEFGNSSVYVTVGE